MLKACKLDEPCCSQNPCCSTDPCCSESTPLKFNDSLAERKDKERLRLWSLIICFISVVLNLAMCTVAFTFAAMRNSPAIFAFAADCCLDTISSAIVIWRYLGTPFSVYSQSREIRACVCLGVLFIFAGIGVLIASSYFLYLKELPRWFPVLIILSGIGGATCFIIGMIKYVLSKRLSSESLFLDALNSVLSGLFALVIIISDVVYLYNKSVWYLDPILSIFLCTGLIIIGSRTIAIHWRFRRYDYEICE
ncbi:hypothetical protein JTE90_012364 [Oedothorax gibbosus]|uniref:Transmembrane protein 163 n=1 Tax=Oedothorax gibbosus TaxID=931172 RepID=A0AAV6US12_9ARAC|nr:hypothetical protein JTE90_012364 [Oedothorax gibbosus]